MDYPCIHCNRQVRPRQQAVECDWCSRWQHRTCNTGISLVAYREAVRLGGVTFVCQPCFNQEKDRANNLSSNADTMPVLEVSVPVVDNNIMLSPPKLVISTTTTDDEMEVESRSDETLQGDYDVPVLESTRRSEDVTLSDWQRRSVYHPNSESVDATASFVIEKSFAEPQVIEERSYEDPAPTDTIVEEDTLQFTVVKGGSSRGKDKLIDSAGFCYTVKNSTAKTRNWWCSVRGKDKKCSAAVRERNGDFIRNSVPHNHPGDLDAHLKVAATAKAKEKAVTNIFCPAMGIVEKVMVEIKDNLPFPAISNPSMELIARQANRIKTEEST